MMRCCMELARGMLISAKACRCVHYMSTSKGGDLGIAGLSLRGSA